MIKPQVPRAQWLLLGAALTIAMSHECLAEVNTPKLFAPGVVSGPADDLSPAFSPDGKAVYFTRGNPSASTIMRSIQLNGRWLPATIASFSGQWNDFEPTIAPDGSFLVFASNRPPTGGARAIDGTFNGKAYPGGGGNLWRIERKGVGWGEPKKLPDTINQGTAVFSPSIAADGSLYFMRADTVTGTFRLYKSQYRSGTYLAAESVRVGDETTEEVDPAIAPDESFLVYTSTSGETRSKKAPHRVSRRQRLGHAPGSER